jgi:hypothetical protein
VLGDFRSERGVVDAVRALAGQGVRGLDAHTPIPVEGLAEALDATRSPISGLAAVAGALGVAIGYGVQWWCNAVDWPLIVGSRPAHSALSFLPITFETGILAASLTIVATLLVLFRFPHVSHPLLGSEAVRRASVDGFWVSVEVEDEAARTAALEAVSRLRPAQTLVVEAGR